MPCSLRSLLDSRHAHLPAPYIIPDRSSSAHSCALSGDRTAHHLACGRKCRSVGRNASARNQEVLYFLREYDAVRNLKVPPRGGHDHFTVGVQELREYPDAVVETGLALHIVLGKDQHSTSMVSTPSLADANAAERPAGPLPMTRTSVSAMTGTLRDGSLISFISCDLLRDDIQSASAAVEYLRSCTGENVLTHTPTGDFT